MSLVLGLDVSTTATKAVLLDADGVVRRGRGRRVSVRDAATRCGASRTRRCGGTRTARRGASRRSTDAGLDGDDVEAVGLTGQMHGLVALDAADEVLRPAILWNDQRTEARVRRRSARRSARERLIAITGNDALPGFTAPKLLWVRRHEPDVWSRIAHVLLPKDYVRLRLPAGTPSTGPTAPGRCCSTSPRATGRPRSLEALEIDPSVAAADLRGAGGHRGVSPEAAAARPACAPGRRSSPAAATRRRPRSASARSSPASSSLSLGTSGVVFATTDGPLVEPEGRLHAFCHAVPGPMAPDGRDALGRREPALVPGRARARASRSTSSSTRRRRSRPGSDGLLFLPYLTGERTPHPDPLARGAFVGLTVRHGRAHLTRAVLEGVAFGLRDSLELMRAAGLAGLDRRSGRPAAGAGARSGDRSSPTCWARRS